MSEYILKKDVIKHYEMIAKDIACYIEKHKKIINNSKELANLSETLMGDAQHCVTNIKVIISRLNREIGNEDTREQSDKTSH